MNYTIENDVLTIIQPEDSQKPNTTHELGYGVQLMETIRREIAEYTSKFEFTKIIEALQRLELYKPMYEACQTRIAELDLEKREEERLAMEAQSETSEVDALLEQSPIGEYATPDEEPLPEEVV